MLIKFAKRFSKQYDKAEIKIRLSYKRKLALFRKDPFNPLLNNHALTGNYAGFRSINITGNWRAIYSKKEEIITFEFLGTHSELYK